MVVGVLRVQLYAPWVHSLKEKRSVVQSLVKKTRLKFNISIAETENMDIHQTITLGISCITNSYSHADSIMNGVLDFIEGSTEAEITDITRQLY